MNASPLPVLLLTHSPLLRGEVRRLVEADGASGIAFHCVEGLEREVLRQMGAVAPKVVLLPLDIANTVALAGCRELRLVERLVAEWRVAVLVLGLRGDLAVEVEAAVESACRAVGTVGYLPRARWTEAGGSTLRAKIGAAARIKVLRPLGGGGQLPAPPPPLPAFDRPATRAVPGAAVADAGRGIVVIGSSAGGPEALRELLGTLPVTLPVPVLLIQHLPPSFGPALAADLSRFTPFGVAVAAVGDELVPGRPLLAPGRRALQVAAGRIAGMAEAETGGVHGHAIDQTMISVATAYRSGAIGVILSGMGEDGVRGLRAIKDRGGLTFGQDEASCHVYGMPRRAAELGLVDSVASPAAIGAAIGRILSPAATLRGEGRESPPAMTARGM